MAQITFDADLTKTDFPLLSDWASRTVVQPKLPTENAARFATPQILFGRNILPTAQGYKSVSFADLLAAATPANTNFTSILTAVGTNDNRALIGVASNSKIYMITGANFIWQDVTPAGWTGGDNVSTGTANGLYYLYLKNKGCYLVDVAGIALTLTALAGITAANILGMTSSMNYLILWDATTIYWSSTSNPLDFVPSLITGAGSATPYDLAGRIITCKKLDTGFVVYTTINMVLANFSNNTQYPWIFRQAANSAGVSSGSYVASSREANFHVALTYAGMLYITTQGAEHIVPEVTDFLAARVYESFNSTTNTLITQYLNALVLYKLALVSSRFIVISYGITEYTDALVYDLSLKKWGAISLTHTECFEIEVLVLKLPGTYNEAGEVGSTYAAASPQPYNEAAGSFGEPPNLGHSFGFLRKDGSVQVAYLDYYTGEGNSVLWLGKYQLAKGNLFQMEEIAVESVDADNAAFTLHVIPSINGKDNLTPIQATTQDIGARVRNYKVRAVGLNQNLLFKGCFNLTSVEITASPYSRR